MAVLEAVVLCALGEGDGVVDLVEVQPFVVPCAEAALAGAVLAGCLDPRAHVAQLRVHLDERLEVEAAERAAVIGHDRDRGQELPSVRIDAACRRRGGGRSWPRSRPGRARRRRWRRAGSPSGTGASGARTSTGSPGNAPRTACGGLELADVQLPTYFDPSVGRGQDQPLVAQHPQHGRLGHHRAVVADHGPHFSVRLGRMRQRMGQHELSRGLPRRSRAPVP